MLKIIPELCDGRMHCLKVCPTHAIRIRGGKALILEKRCVDCGRCLEVCPHQAIVPQTDAFAHLEQLAYRVAVPSPALFGQFPREYCPEEILQALSRIGFHEAVDITQACEWVTWAIREYLHEHHTPRPLISSFCPAVVRLIQVRYPALLEHLIPIKGPEVIAVEMLKQKRTSQEQRRGEEFSAIYLTPCPAMIPRPAEEHQGDPAALAGAIAIRDLYNPLLAFLNHQPDAYRWPMPTMGKGLQWARLGGSGQALRERLWVTVSGLNETIMVLEDVESGKLHDTDYIECWNCLGGCIGGPLTVENFYLAYHKIILAEQRNVQMPPLNVDQLRKQFRQGFFSASKRPRLDSLTSAEVNLVETLQRRKTKEKVLNLLPMIDCGVCGAPDCKTFAEDIARGQANINDCIFYGSDHLNALKENFKIKSDD